MGDAGSRRFAADGDLAEVARRAWALGQERYDEVAVLTFGPLDTEAGTQQVGSPRYYRFLTGITLLLEAERVVEFGTYHGGSARAIEVGLPAHGRVLTFDVERRSLPALKGRARIDARVFDGQTLEPLEICSQVFGGDPVDLAFVDCEHNFWETMRCFMQCEWMGASFVVVDDIALNDEMRTAWEMVCRRYGADHCLDVETVLPELRRGGPAEAGFGLVRLPPGRSAGWLRDHAYLLKRRLRR